MKSAVVALAFLAIAMSMSTLVDGQLGDLVPTALPSLVDPETYWCLNDPLDVHCNPACMAFKGTSGSCPAVGKVASRCVCQPKSG